MRGKRGVGERRDGGEGENLSVEDTEVKGEEKVKEQQEKRQLQSVFCFHKMTTVHKSLNFWRALRKAVRNTIIKKNTTKSYISRKRNTKATQTLVVSIRFSPMCCIPRNKPR